MQTNRVAAREALEEYEQGDNPSVKEVRDELEMEVWEERRQIYDYDDEFYDWDYNEFYGYDDEFYDWDNPDDWWAMEVYV